jgi:hypothetical protein
MPTFAALGTKHEARAALALAGGLASQADLARRWDLSRSRAWQIVREPGFPDAVAQVNGCDVWLVAEVEHWREHERALCLAREKVRKFAPELLVEP